jgi:hypothetical protein
MVWTTEALLGAGLLVFATAADNSLRLVIGLILLGTAIFQLANTRNMKFPAA